MNIPLEYHTAMKQVKKEGNYSVSNCKESRLEDYLGVCSQSHWYSLLAAHAAVFTLQIQSKALEVLSRSSDLCLWPMQSCQHQLVLKS